MLRLASVALFLTSATSVAALHVLPNDLAPVADRLSEYANEEYGWLMTVAFGALGLGMVALGLGLRSESGSGPRAWLIPAAIAAAGIGMIVAGVYPTDPSGAETAAEVIHSRASGLASLLLIGAVYASSVQRGPGRLRPEPGPIGALAVASVALGCLSPILHDTTWSGLGQRLLWATLMMWLLLTAWRLGTPAHTDRLTAVTRDRAG